MAQSGYVGEEGESQESHGEVNDPEVFSPSPYVVTPSQLREGDYCTLDDVKTEVQVQDE